MQSGSWKSSVYPKVSGNLVKEIDPEMTEIYPAVIESMDQVLAGNKIFAESLVRANAFMDFEPLKLLVIADFNYGSDSVIVLDYTDSIDSPCVRYLKWGNDNSTVEWKKISQTFREFLDRLKIS